MLRKIIKISNELCNGCGLCADACHEGAIGMRGGKAVLLRDDYCDGLGDCLPVCPTGAITFEEREALAYNEAEVKANMAASGKAHGGGCPGTAAKSLHAQHEQAHQHRHSDGGSEAPCGCPSMPAQRLNVAEPCGCSNEAAHAALTVSRLAQWPVQIKLVPTNAPYFDGANLLIAADCAAYSHAGFHENFMKNRVTIIGCPKLDMVEYADKLTAIIAQNNIKSVTVVRMEVPCCGGIESATVTALKNSGKMIPWNVVTLSVDGRILD